MRIKDQTITAVKILTKTDANPISLAWFGKRIKIRSNGVCDRIQPGN